MVDFNKKMKSLKNFDFDISVQKKQVQILDMIFQQILLNQWK
ncbi:unnamed protein product [Paramecium pentaurelia]|uniref:Uncharacterized protein n=1 Tax=Paramecium pentaurelia TaxID=43138 RepID=A0A8S1W115_9CILI|nr:unnamed protein product [Paramecium pentaurelia]